jgi:hypothetical protein
MIKMMQITNFAPIVPLGIYLPLPLYEINPIIKDYSNINYELPGKDLILPTYNDPAKEYIMRLNNQPKN